MTTVNVLDKGFVRLVDSMPLTNGDAAVVQAARVSYGEGTKTINDDRALIRYLLRHQHTSPFEMVEFKFHIKLPIFVARQMIRTRTANANECSARYSICRDEFYIPDLDRVLGQSKDNKQCSGGELDSDLKARFQRWIVDSSNAQYSTYSSFVEEGVARELARIGLPLNIYTEWYWKIDLHNLLRFLSQRTHSHAQYEIRVYADAMLELIRPLVPLSLQAWEDYVRGAVNLSAQEVGIVKKLLENLDSDSLRNFISANFPADFLSKRELSDLCHKLIN